MKSWLESFNELFPVCEDEEVLLTGNAILHWLDEHTDNELLFVRCSCQIKAVSVREGAIEHVYAITATGVTMDW